MKAKLKRSIESCVRSWTYSRLGRFVQGIMINSAMERSRTVVHNSLRLTFATPNALNDFRVDTFETKEPETLDWIDQIPASAVLYDIGANVGLYSCYAARRCSCRVFSFEPSVFNLELLARNSHLNGVTDRLTLVPMAVSDGLAVSTLNMSSTDWGGALSTFGKSFGFDGEPLRSVFAFSTLGISLDQAVQLLKIPAPNYIKLDVDGIEHLILRGGVEVLRGVESILVEINDGFHEQADVATRCLEEAGLVLTDKRRWEEGGTGPHQQTYNQIWRRPA